jgi:hypothetical protein
MPRKNKSLQAGKLHAIASCSAKRKYMTESQAQEAAEYQMLLKPTLELTTYMCGQCGSWHLTRRKPLVYNV